MKKLLLIVLLIVGCDETRELAVINSNISEGDTVSISSGLIIKFTLNPSESFFQADEIIKEHSIWEIKNSQSFLLNSQPQTFWYEPTSYTCAFIQYTTILSPDGTGEHFSLAEGHNTFQIDNIFSLTFYTDTNSDFIQVIPNPYISHEYNEYPYNNLVRFTRLPEVCDITILSTYGDSIKTINHSSAFDGNEWWNLSNMQDEQINFGIYQFKVQSSNFSFDNGVFVYPNN